MKKRIIMLILMMCMTALLMPMMSGNAVALSASEITQEMNQLKNTYPSNTYWNHAPGSPYNGYSVTNTPCGTNGYTCNQLYGGSQCYAFARHIASILFGSYPQNVEYFADGYVDRNGWTCIRNAQNVTLEPGDYIRADGHSAIVWYVDGDNVYVAQCWGSYPSLCKINWGSFWGSTKCTTVSDILRTNFVGVWKHPGSSSGDTTPGKPSLKGMKSEYYNTENIVFSWNGTANTTHYNMYFDKLNSNGEYERIDTIHYAESGLRKRFSVGQYRVNLQSTNSNAYTPDGSTWAYTDSGWVYFSVIDPTPGKPALLNMKPEYTTDEDISFTWKATANTTHYNLYFYKMNSSGEYELSDYTHYAESGLKKRFDAGEYRVQLQATNSNAYTSDGSTWVYTDGDFVSFTVSDKILSGTCGADLTWKFDKTTGTLTISGTGAMTEYEDDMPWEEFKDDIKKLVLNEGITSISSCAFYKCNALVGKLTIPESVTYIGASAFSGCTGLTGSLELPEGLTYIGYASFKNCKGFTGKLVIPDTVTEIGEHAFSNCSGFTGISLSKKLKKIPDHAFDKCSGLSENLYIPNGVTKIGDHAFSMCSGIDRLSIPKSVQAIGAQAFGGCKGLSDGGISFLGDAPKVESNSVIFGEVHAEVVYPAENSTWTEEVMGIMGDGATLTWRANYALRELSVSPQTLTLNVGESYTLTTHRVPVNSPEAEIWNSSDPSIATVSDGTVTAVAPGSVTILVNAGSYVSECAVVVKKPVGVTVSGQVSGYISAIVPTVKLTNGSKTYSAKVESAVSNSGGLYTWKFNVTEVPAGTYDLIVSKDNHLTTTVKSIKVNANNINLCKHINASISTIALVAGDVNGDGVVNSSDLNAVWSTDNYFKSVGTTGVNPAADVNGDRTINSDDLNIIWKSENYLKVPADCLIDYRI